MEDFTVDFYKEKNKETGALDMQVSSICEKDGVRKAYVIFSDGSRKAEGEIPKCVITSSEGFSEEEVRQLEEYMKTNLDMLKKMAAGINPLRAFMK